MFSWFIIDKMQYHLFYSFPEIFKKLSICSIRLSCEITFDHLVISFHHRILTIDLNISKNLFYLKLYFVQISIIQLWKHELQEHFKQQKSEYNLLGCSTYMSNLFLKVFTFHKIFCWKWISRPKSWKWVSNIFRSFSKIDIKNLMALNRSISCPSLPFFAKGGRGPSTYKSLLCQRLTSLAEGTLLSEVSTFW